MIPLRFSSARFGKIGLRSLRTKSSLPPGCGLPILLPPTTCNCANGYMNRRWQLRRSQSTTENTNRFQRKPPSREEAARIVKHVFSFGPLRDAMRSQGLKKLYKESPEETVLALVLLFGIGCCCVYAIYAYFTYFQSPQFTRYPPDVAQSLRRALYYSNYKPDDQQALKYYKMALEQCDAHGMDFFCDEVMGLKIQIAAWLEKIGHYKESIDVLESVMRENKRWLEKMEQSVSEGLVDKQGMLVGFDYGKKKKVEAEGGDAAASSGQEEEEEPPENLWAKRTRILGKSVGISVKLGELYADEHVLQGDDAGERLIWAVETLLRELQRRKTEGVKEVEGEWMDSEQIGGALEALANHYEKKDLHYLAAPLYLQAITLSPPKSCHTAVLMNNLAISLAQQPVNVPIQATIPPGPGTSAGGSSAGKRTREALLSSARQWATHAQAISNQVTGEDRSPECDEACAVALCNLGEIEAMAGNKKEAERRFRECAALSQRVGFEDGIQQAQEGLDALAAGGKKK